MCPKAGTRIKDCLSHLRLKDLISWMDGCSLGVTFSEGQLCMHLTCFHSACEEYLKPEFACTSAYPLNTILNITSHFLFYNNKEFI